MIIAIPRDDYGFIVVGKLSHCVQDEFCIDVALNDPFIPLLMDQSWLKDQTISCTLEISILLVLSFNSADK